MAGARVAVDGAAALQPLRHPLLRHALARGGHARLAEVLLRKDVDGDLREALRGQQILHLEDHRPIRVGDPGSARHKREGGEGILPRDGGVTGYLHGTIRIGVST